MACDLSQEQLKHYLDYDPETGAMRRRVATSNRVKVGDVAGSVMKPAGYRAVCVGGRSYYEHRLAWLYVHGEWPKRQIDHINGCKSDNGIENLREATPAQNQQNARTRADNRSGLAGACFDSRRGKWVSGIKVNGVRKHLGSFSTPEEAHAAYVQAKAEHHVFSPQLRN